MAFGALLAFKEPTTFEHEYFGISMRTFYLKMIFETKLKDIQMRVDLPPLAEPLENYLETCLQELLKDESTHFAQLTEFQFKVIEQINHLTGTSIPFDTLLIFLLYSPFLPTQRPGALPHFLLLLKSYAELLITDIQEKKMESLHRGPHNEGILQVVFHLFHNSNLSLSSKDYKKAITMGDDRLDNRKTAIAQKIRNALAAHV